MDYTRIYWFCFLGIGVLFFVQAISKILTSGLNIAVVLGFIGGVGMVAGALYSLRNLGEADGPTQPNLVFWAVVLGFVLMVAGTVLQLV